MKDTIRININKLGPISRCSFKYHPFTIITGYSSTGKSLLLMTIYNLQTQLEWGFKGMFEQFTQLKSIRVTTKTIEDFLQQHLYELLQRNTHSDSSVSYSLGENRVFDIRLNIENDLYLIDINDYHEEITVTRHDDLRVLSEVFSRYFQSLFFEETYLNGGWYDYAMLPNRAASRDISNTERVKRFLNEELFINKGMFTIDTPESCLHPNDQIEITDRIIRQHSEGSHIALITNSDYILQRLNQIIKISWLKDRDLQLYNTLISKHSEFQNLYIHPENLQHMYMVPKGKHRVVVHNYYYGSTNEPKIHFKSLYKIVDNMNDSQYYVDDIMYEYERKNRYGLVEDLTDEWSDD